VFFYFSYFEEEARGPSSNQGVWLVVGWSNALCYPDLCPPKVRWERNQGEFFQHCRSGLVQDV
jgi:hypothetical protein